MADPKLVDMKRTPSQEKAQMAEYKDDGYYPTTLYLGSDEVEKLGIGNLSSKQDFMIMAQAHVKSINISDSGGKKRVSMSIELRKMAASASKSETADDEKADKLYDNKG